MFKKLLFLIVIFFFSIASLLAHSGRTDKYGGHNNRKTGGYHYHNAGSLHNSSNPHQNHTTCGICSATRPKQDKENDQINISDKETIKALQAGLKCMGYKITKIDGKLGANTKLAIKEYINNQK